MEKENKTLNESDKGYKPLLFRVWQEKKNVGCLFYDFGRPVTHPGELSDRALVNLLAMINKTQEVLSSLVLERFDAKKEGGQE